MGKIIKHFTAAIYAMNARSKAIKRRGQASLDTFRHDVLQSSQSIKSILNPRCHKIVRRNLLPKIWLNLLFEIRQVECA